MNIQICIKESFSVIGKEGSTKDGNGFISRLWEDANAHFSEVESLAKRNTDGSFSGIWGNMSDFSHSFLPWEEGFRKGLYLAGVECNEEAKAPKGWTKWTIPGYEYLVVENEDKEIFPKMISYLNENQIFLVGAVHEFNVPTTGKAYLYFPIKKL